MCTRSQMGSGGRKTGKVDMKTIKQWKRKKCVFVCFLTRNYSLSEFSSVQSVMSDYLRPHGLQQARLPCPSPTPGAYSNSCPLSW